MKTSAIGLLSIVYKDSTFKIATNAQINPVIYSDDYIELNKNKYSIAIEKKIDILTINFTKIYNDETWDRIVG